MHTKCAHCISAQVLTYAYIYRSVHASTHMKVPTHLLISCILQVITTTWHASRYLSRIPHFCMGTHIHTSSWTRLEEGHSNRTGTLTSLVFSPSALWCSLFPQLTFYNVTWPAPGSLICYTSGSQPVGHNPLWGSNDPFRGSPKTIRKQRYLHYDS